MLLRKEVLVLIFGKTKKPSDQFGMWTYSDRTIIQNIEPQNIGFTTLLLANISFIIFLPNSHNIST